MSVELPTGHPAEGNGRGITPDLKVAVLDTIKSRLAGIDRSELAQDLAAVEHILGRLESEPAVLGVACAYGPANHLLVVGIAADSKEPLFWYGGILMDSRETSAPISPLILEPDQDLRDLIGGSRGPFNLIFDSRPRFAPVAV